MIRINLDKENTALNVTNVMKIIQKIQSTETLMKSFVEYVDRYLECI